MTFSECSKKVFLIGFNTKMLILLTNLEMLISASFLTTYESSDYVNEKYILTMQETFEQFLVRG